MPYVVIVTFLFFFVCGVVMSTRKENLQRTQQIKNSMVSIVKSVQTGILLPLDLSVSVSDEMREKLCYPLTRDIIHTICTTKTDPQESRFIYRCVDCVETRDEITGTVEICIDYVNEAIGLDVHYKFVPLRVQWKIMQGKGWCVSAVEHD